jgi:hypothetical protein
VAENGGKYVTWQILLPILVTMIFSVIGGTWAIVNNHAAQPKHPGSAARVEIQYLQDSIKLLRDDIRELRSALAKETERRIESKRDTRPNSTRAQ